MSAPPRIAPRPPSAGTPLAAGRRLTFCTFVVAGELFGVEVGAVQEVVRAQEMTRVPLTSSVVRGLLNLRGEIVTALDLRRRLGFPPRDDGPEPMHVIVRSADGPVSLLVDAIGEVVEVPAEELEEPPATLTADRRALLRAVVPLEGALLLVLDPEPVIDIAAFVA